jgi:hypothetical protein
MLVLSIKAPKSADHECSILGIVTRMRRGGGDHFDLPRGIGNLSLASGNAQLTLSGT